MGHAQCLRRSLLLDTNTSIRISEFAPSSIQRLLSYLVGWLTVLGWQVGLASVSYAAAVQIEGFAILVNPDGTPRCSRSLSP